MIKTGHFNILSRHVLRRFSPSVGVGNNSGQSTVEYLIVTFTIVAMLITVPNIYSKVSTTMQNKYHSYSFGIAISDPPRKAFDDSVQKDAEKVGHIFNIFHEIEDLFSDSIFPDLSEGKLPSWDDIKKFGGKIKELF